MNTAIYSQVYKRIYAVALLILCCSFLTNAQFGISTKNISAREILEKSKEYHEECKRVKSHNEWIDNKFNSFNERKQLGLFLSSAGGVLVLVGSILAFSSKKSS